MVGKFGEGGKGGIAGVYVNRDVPEERLELNEDGTFWFEEFVRSLITGKVQLKSFTGGWKVKDDELKLLFFLKGIIPMCATGQIRENKLIDQQGKVWVKQ